MRPTIGTTISDRYELLGYLGRGGFNSVFRARDQKNGSEVAVKWLDASDDRTRALLLRQARIMSQLAQRTAGVEAYRDFVQEHGDVYLVTEIVHGRSLRDWQWEPPPSRRAVLGIYTRIARVLHEIHDAGFVHRDMKPTNVMVVKEDGTAVKIVDFMLAVEINELDALTGSNTIVGTPVYMSPEMVEGKPVTAASDVFALGCMLFEAIAGRRLWSSSSITELLSARLASPPDLGELEGSDVGALIRSMLAMEPEARPSALTVAQTLAALAGVADGADARAPEADLLTANPSAVLFDPRPLLPHTGANIGEDPTDTLRDPLTSANIGADPADTLRDPLTSTNLGEVLAHTPTDALTGTHVDVKPAGTRADSPQRSIPITQPAASIWMRVVTRVGGGAHRAGRLIARVAWSWKAALALAVACVIGLVWQLGARGYPATALLGWAIVFLAGASLVALGVAYRRRELHSRSPVPAHVALRLLAIEERLRQMSEMTHSIVIELDQIKPQIDDSRLKELMRESVLIALSEMQVGAGTGDVGKAIKALADVARSEDGPPPWHKRLSTWLTVGGLAVGCVGGALGIISSSGLWKPNAPPAIQAITLDGKRASRETPMELRVDATDPDGDRLEYEYAASEGTIQGNGALALWRPDPAPRTGFVRIDVTVFDGHGRAIRSQTVRINSRPDLAIVGPDAASPGATVVLKVEGEPDPDGDPLSYRWSASLGELRDAMQQYIELVMPGAPSQVRVRCTISDGAESWNLDRVIEVRE